MKKSFILLGMLVLGYANAQEGKVGINTDTPSATLQVKSQTGTDNKTKNLELENANATKLVTVLDNGYVGIGTDAPYAKLHIVSEGTPGTAGPVSGNDLVYEYFENGTTSTSDPMSIFFKRYGGKVGALSNIKNNTTIGNIFFQGYYNNNTHNLSELRTTYTGDGTSATARLHMGILGSVSDLVINRATSGGTTNVGIGTDTPTQKLEVIGNILANRGGLMSIIENNNTGGWVELRNPLKEGKEANRWRLYNMTNKDAGGTSKYTNGLHFWAYAADGTNLSSKMVLTDEGNLGIGFGSNTNTQQNLKEKLEVMGNIRATSLQGTGTRNVVADENGVLQIGSATATPAVEIGSTIGMQCNAENRGKMNFIPNDSGNDIFGICLRNKDGNYYWGYMVGGNNPTNGTGAFGSGL